MMVALPRSSPSPLVALLFRWLLLLCASLLLGGILLPRLCAKGEVWLAGTLSGGLLLAVRSLLARLSPLPLPLLAVALARPLGLWLCPLWALPLLPPFLLRLLITAALTLAPLGQSLRRLLMTLPLPRATALLCPADRARRSGFRTSTFPPTSG